MIKNSSQRRKLKLAPLVGIILVVGCGLWRQENAYAQGPWVPSGPTGTDISNTNSGNVGVGTNTPGSPVHVKGSGEILRIETTSAAGGGLNYVGLRRSSSLIGFAGFTGASDDFDLGTSINGSVRFWTSNTERMRITTAGNLGIGTTNPQNPLHISGNAITGTNLQVESTDTGGRAWVLKSSGSASAGGPGNLIFRDVTAGLNLVTILGGSGNVGIGTSSPAAMLDVHGTANFTGTVTGGNFAATYQDVAEWVPASKAMAPGTVVVLDPQLSNHVLSSTAPYDTRVAGVISLQPGLALGQGGAGKVLVATTGRVRVKVDATRVPIQVGDLLVTSDTEGVAMKSMPLKLGDAEIHRPGTLLGKALEPLASGKGEILVLLSLQ